MYTVTGNSVACTTDDTLLVKMGDCLPKSTTTVTTTYDVNISMLGGFKIEVNGTCLTDDMNRSHKLWGVLCYLITHRDRSIPSSELIDQFWPGDSDSSSPVSALKTLLHRARAMLEPLFDPSFNPIVSRRGSYMWNPDSICCLDIDQFQVYCNQARKPGASVEMRLQLYEKAFALYKGDLVPKLASLLWAITLQTHYHAMYVNMVKSYTSLLEELNQYDLMYDILQAAIRIEPLDEQLYILLIRALLGMGRDRDALSMYEATTDLLYRNLNVRPSAELRALYNERIMKLTCNAEADLASVQSDLLEVASRPGAFVCDYGFFKEAYRLEARRVMRSGVSVHIALLTISFPDLATPSPQSLEEIINQMETLLVVSLRKGDVVSLYSKTQFVVLLHASNFENSVIIMERIIATFYQKHRKSFLKLSYKVRELEFED